MRYVENYNLSKKIKDLIEYLVDEIDLNHQNKVSLKMERIYDELYKLNYVDEDYNWINDTAKTYFDMLLDEKKENEQEYQYRVMKKHVFY